MTLTAGTLLGPYEILAPLGSGGMGAVYRARDSRLGREVALKVLPPAAASDPERLRRFQQEASTTGQLNHPNLLAIFDVGTHNGTPYLISELLEGDTLRDRMDGSPLPLRKAMDYATQIAHGLAAAHEKGVIHRDLKPENLFVTRSGRVKILDFGLAKLTTQFVSESHERLAPTITVGSSDTAPGVVMGTVGYMAPEQVRGQAVDHRADLFSFGTVLFEMLSGQRAFRRDSAVETMNAILKEDPPDLMETAPFVPPALERILRRCLEKSPEERFQSARDLAFALEALSDATSSGKQPRLTAPEKGRGRMRALRVAAAAVALLVAAAFWVGRRTAEGPQPTYLRQTFRPGTIIRARFAPHGR
ncbi:MAG TPA: serine/threonine-protein kinase, partial [Isosphaeraceae bacterium]|nr:serine/threonine-protein kinase [Isosphaeraceae bacterium]